MSAPAGATPLLEAALDYADTLYRDAPEDTYILVWTLKGRDPNAEKDSYWFTSPGEAAAHAVGIADRNVYLGMAFTRVERGRHFRYLHAHAAGVTCLRIDVDVVGPTHAQGALPPTVEAARALVAEALPLEPTMVVVTGGGIQAYWCFSEPWVFEDDRDRDAARDLSERFQNTIIARAGAHGWVIESTADLPRVMRIPGTFNCNGPEPVLAAILELDDARRYSPEDFEPFLLEPARPAGAGEPRPHEGTPLPLGFATRVFVEHGAPDKQQRPMALHAARNYWGAGRDVEEAVSAVWRGIKASPWDPAYPWTEAEVRRLVENIYASPAPALKPLAPGARLLLRGKPIGERAPLGPSRLDDDRLPPIRRRSGIVLPPPRRPDGVAIETLLEVPA